MKKIIKRLSILITIITIFFLLIIILIDNKSLDSLLISEDDTLAINEVNVLTVDYNKVVYNEINALNVKKSNENTTPTSKNVVKSSSGWVWPTGKNYVITTYYSSYHRALDISGVGYGSNIYAANSGIVSMVRGGCIPGNLSCNGRGGNYIVINHQNGYYTVYMHLKNINVNTGQTVSAGQVIGTMGNTGNVYPVPTSSSSVNGTHLHFCLYKGEPYKGGYEVNPMSLY